MQYITPQETRCVFFKKYMERYRSQTVYAEFFYHIAVDYYGIHLYNLEIDVLDIADDLEIVIEPVDRQRGYSYYNELIRTRRIKENFAAVKRHEAHKKAFNTL